MAIWNKDYHSKISKGERPQSARSQILHYLDIHSNKHLLAKAENIHYEKNLGLAELPKDKVLEFCRRHHPDRLDEVTQDFKNYEGDYIIDFENLFSTFERVPIYDNVLECAKTGIIKDDEHKAWVSMFLTHHVLRSPQYLDALIERNKNRGIEKFETLITLKWSLQEKVFLTKEIISVYKRQWTIYKIDSMPLPLSDFPIIATRGSVFAPLGPDVLLFVTSQDAHGVGISYERRIPDQIMKEFLRTTIFRINKGLVFSDEQYLLKCKESQWWKKRRKDLGYR